MMTTVCLQAVLILLHLLLLHLGCGTESLVADNPNLVDPYAYNYDHNSQTNKYSDEEIQEMVENKCSKLVEDACIKCSEEMQRNCGNESFDPLAIPKLPEPREKDQKKCDSVLFRHLIKRITKVFTEERTEKVVITLDSYKIERLQKFMSDETGDVVEGADILDILSISLSPLGSLPYTSNWFERMFSFSFSKGVIGLLTLVTFFTIFKLLLTGDLSFMRVICALMVTALVISFFWSYVLLYQKKIAERMADDAQRKEYEELCHPHKNLTAFQKAKVFFGIHQKDDRCQKFIESFQIDPFLEVSPIEAITYTFGNIITSLSGALGKGLGNFNQDFFTHVSFANWIPAMVFTLLLVAVILAVCLYCGRRLVITREVRENQAPQVHGRDNDRIEDAYLSRIEGRKEPAPQLPCLKQPAEVLESKQSCDLRKRKIENAQMEKRIAQTEKRIAQMEKQIVTPERTGEDYFLGKEENIGETSPLYGEVEQKLEERVEDINPSAQSERKLGAAPVQSEDGNDKLQPQKSEESGVHASNTGKCQKAKDCIESYEKKEVERDNSTDQRRMGLQSGDAKAEHRTDDEDDFVVIRKE